MGVTMRKTMGMAMRIAMRMLMPPAVRIPVRRVALAGQLAVLALPLFAGFGCSAAPDSAVENPAADGADSVDAAAPILSVELFGEGSISTELGEFATTFSPDGDTVYFNRLTADRERIDLVFSVRTESGWSAALPLAPLAGVRAIDPFMSHDGQRLYFSAGLPHESRAPDSYNIWFLERDAEGGWSPPSILPAQVNSDDDDIFNAIARDGTMVFSSRGEGVRRLYLTRQVGAEWEPRALLPFGAESGASNGTIHPDGRLIVFAMPGQTGFSDLFVSCRLNQGWGDPQILPTPLNSDFTDFAPGFGPGYLYFTSERPGVVPAMEDASRPPGDIYRTPITAIEAFCGQVG